MGAIREEARISGRSLKEAFANLQESDREEHGNDIYSGGWNNSPGVKEISVEEFDKRYKNDDISKHECAIAKCVVKPVGNNNKIKTVVTNFPVKGTRKWVTKYQATSFKSGGERVIVSENKQAIAIKKVREYVEKNPKERIDLHIVKVLEGDSRVANIVYKKSTNEKDGTWMVYGVMSY